MKKIYLLIPFIKILFRRPSVIFKALYHAVIQQDKRAWVEKAYGSALREINILKLFPSLNETIDPFSCLYGTSLPIDLAVLKMFARRIPNCDYLEIGTWRGESLANVAPLVENCISISLSAGEMAKFGWGASFGKLQRVFSKNLKNVKHIEANSRNFDFDSLGKKFDLIFIDGDHSFAGVKSDTINAFKLLKDNNSVIIWHDYTKNYEHVDWEVFAGIIAGTDLEYQKNIFHISNTLCAVYLNQKIDSYPFTYPTFPINNFKIKLEAENIKHIDEIQL
jgi:hypothetical protein